MARKGKISRSDRLRLAAFEFYNVADEVDESFACSGSWSWRWCSSVWWQQQWFGQQTPLVRRRGWSPSQFRSSSPVWAVCGISSAIGAMTDAATLVTTRDE
jgi:hypothetical protein